MPANNLRQAEVPVGGDAIPNPIGTAPGLRCEVEIARPEACHQGRVRRARRALRDDEDGHRAGAARPARAFGAAFGDRVAVAEDVGRVGVGARRDDRRARRPADQPHDRVPRPRHRGHLRAHDREGGDRGRGRARCSTRRTWSCARCSATSCSRSTTTRWSPPCSACARRGGGRSGWGSRSPVGSSVHASPTCPARAARSAARWRRTRPR